MLARQLDEADVARVQIAHRRHERDMFAVAAPFVQLIPQVLFARYDQHRSS
jgi:hypothetical protein